jgi:hypothetical protein
MSDIESGLQFYSSIKSLFSILLILLICCSLSYCFYITLNKNYKLANNGKISFKHVDDLGKILNTCDVNNSIPDCKYIVEYDDISHNHYSIPNQIIDPKKPPQIGNTQIYYENDIPSNYIISFINPSNGILILLFVIFIFLIFALINLYLIRTYKGYGAVIGGIEATTDIFNRFNKN